MRAEQYCDSGVYVWLEGEDGIEPRRIELGELGDSMAEVRRGLDEGDRVVVNPRDNLPEDADLFDAPVSRRRDRFGGPAPVSPARRLIAAGHAAGG